MAGAGIRVPVSSVAGLGTGVGTFLGTPSSANLAAALTDEMGTGVVQLTTSFGQVVTATKRLYRANVTGGSTFVTISDTAYWQYVGYTLESITPKYVAFHVSVGGTGAQTAEVIVASSAAAPAKAGATLTKLVANGTLDDCTTAGVKRNTSAMATAVAAGVHLWIGVRFALASTQPTCIGVLHDLGAGQVQSTATAGALTGSGPWTGALITSATTAVAPLLEMQLD